MGSATPKANAVDFEISVWGHALKGFISYTTPIYSMQPFRSHSMTPYLKNGTSCLEHWPVLGWDIAGEWRGQRWVGGCGFYVVFICVQYQLYQPSASFHTSLIMQSLGLRRCSSVIYVVQAPPSPSCTTFEKFSSCVKLLWLWKALCVITEIFIFGDFSFSFFSLGTYGTILQQLVLFLRGPLRK